MLVATLTVPCAFVLGLMLVTASGARRRGVGTGLAALAGLGFPITWAVWYVRDEHPYRPHRAHRPEV
jgi:hypothetical protein